MSEVVVNAIEELREMNLMTTKRFVKTHNTINWWAILDKGKELLEDEVVELLNELHEEKEQLQSRINDYDVALKTLQDLTERKLKENEQLKSDKKGYVKRYSELFDEYKKNKKENEQLKKILHFLQNDNAESILNVLNTQQNEIVRLVEENEHLKQKLELYGEKYPTGRWITELKSEELKKELGE